MKYFHQGFGPRLVEIMKQAKIRPELIHAFKKTGRLLTEENKEYLTLEDLEEWDCAIAEGQKLHAVTGAECDCELEKKYFEAIR